MDRKALIINKIKGIEREQNIDNSSLETENENIEQEEQELEVQHKNGSLRTVFAKFLEEKHTITYKRLVVPQSMRSIYWKFYGFPADTDGQILTKLKIVCLLCKTQIAYNRNTSNLRMHLQNKHIQELRDLEAFSPPRKQVISQESKEKRAQKRMLKAAMANSSQHIYTTDAEGTVQISGDIQFVTDSNIPFSEHCEDEDISENVKPLILAKKNLTVTNTPDITFLLTDENQQSSNNKSVSEAIVEFLIMDLQLPQIVQEQGFQRLVATLKSPCHIPSKSSLEDDIIPRTYESFRESILSNISTITSEISIAAEEWTSNCGENFFTFLIYYQNSEEAALESKMLCTIHAPKEWNETHWENAINGIFKNWCIDIEKITAFIASTDRVEFINALKNKNLSVIPCLLHSLQVCAQACFNDEQIAKVLTKCRTAIGSILSDPRAASELAAQEQLFELEQNVMVMDDPSVWTSTYTMLQQMIPRREIITSLLNEIPEINQYSVDINDEDWQIINDIVDVLQFFKVTIDTLSDERIPLISLLKPLLWQLVSTHLKTKEEDSEIASSIKDSMAKMLCLRYADPNVNILLQISTTLDPRFKEVPYATDEDKKLVNTPIKEMLTKYIEESQVIIVKTEESCTKKSRLSGMELLLGGLQGSQQSITAQEKANLEFAQYQSESTAPLSNCPLEWWSKISIKCPNLGKVASRYNCIPVCCPPSSRIPAEMQLSYNAKRAALPPHLVDKLLFLHANYNLV